ncbi:MAG: hypothetical protein IK997_02105 [Bacilli bacterium]|nr:hypothetical protein [Bacilli bacterium]
MDTLIVALQVLLYLAGIMILVVFSVVGIRLIKLLDKTDVILDDVQSKVKSLDDLFEAIDKVGYGFNYLTTSIIKKANSIFPSVLRKKRKKREEDEDE